MIHCGGVVAGWYWVFSIIVTACYTGCIISFIAFPAFPSVIDYIWQLWDDGYSIGTLRESASDTENGKCWEMLSEGSTRSRCTTAKSEGGAKVAPAKSARESRYTSMRNGLAYPVPLRRQASKRRMD